MKIPCLSILNRKNGNATGLEKNTRPRNAGILAKAKRTKRITRSWNGVAFCTKGVRRSCAVRYRPHRNWQGIAMATGTKDEYQYVCVARGGIGT